MRRFVSFLVGLICGAVVGATAALLLAPMSGQELQESARERLEEIVENARQAYEDSRAELERQLEELKKGIESATGEQGAAEG